MEAVVPGNQLQLPWGSGNCCFKMHLETTLTGDDSQNIDSAHDLLQMASSLVLSEVFRTLPKAKTTSTWHGEDGCLDFFMLFIMV